MVAVVLRNTTADVTLRLVAASLSHGDWDVPVPALVPPQSVAAWTAESDGLWTGTQGTAQFAVESDPSQIVTLNWDNPFVGDNSFSADAPAPFHMSYTGGAGDTTVVVFVFGS
jgi:hypothetical protein